MSEGIPFDKSSIDIIIADLSLHYFDEETTYTIIKDVHSVLNTNGLLFCILNSTNEIVKVLQTQDKYLFKNEGIYRRFFDQREIERFFTREKWEYMYMEEYELSRLNTITLY